MAQTPISQKLLNENQNLVLTLPVTGSQEFDLVTFRTLQTDAFYLDYDDEMPVLDPGQNTEFQALREDSFGGTGESIFEIEDQPFTLHHYSVGLDKEGVRVYNAFTGQPQHGHVTGVQVTPGDEKGFVHSQYTMTKTAVPTDEMEQIKFEGPTVSYGFHNDNNTKVNPKATVFGKSYEVLPITDPDTKKDIVAGRKPASFVTVGGLQNISPSFPDKWPDEGPNQFSNSDSNVVRVGNDELQQALKRSRSGGGRQ